jgi:hypothetical protein
LSNIQLKLRKEVPVRLRSIGLSEAWLQDQISLDPSLLGLGDLVVIQKEKIQPSGGRIDFLMSDPENETRYEVELMLGAVDESHIIRTIEYWDMERQRYPTLEHRAVIIAEEITARFFNVIRLLNRAIPIIAIQLGAFQVNDEVVLQFIRVLDTYEFGADPDDDEPTELVDRGYWEKRSRAESLAVVDSISALAPSAQGKSKITYNRGHIALGTSGYNFCWFYPRRVASHCHMHIKVKADSRQGIIDLMETKDLEARNRGRSAVSFDLTVTDINEHRDLISEIIRTAEEWSHR